jgi:hypothetical protein
MKGRKGKYIRPIQWPSVATHLQDLRMHFDLLATHPRRNLTLLLLTKPRGHPVRLAEVGRPRLGSGGEDEGVQCLGLDWFSTGAGRQ